MVARLREAAQLRSLLDDFHQQDAVRRPHTHALRRPELRVQRVRAHVHTRQLSDPVRGHSPDQVVDFKL